MAQATSGEKLITIDGAKYKVRTEVVYQDGLGTPGTLSTTAPIRYVVQYQPLSTVPVVGNPLQPWVTLGERDNTNQNNWIFTPAAGAGFQKALIANGPSSLTTSLDEATVNALSTSAGVTKQQATQILQVAPNVAPTAPAPVQPPPQSPSPPGSNKPPVEDTTVDFSNISQINPDKENPTFSQAFGISELIYPTNIAKNGQDFIKFDVIKYNTRKLNVSGPIGVLENRSTTVTRFGSIILPIQPSISDSNNVDWNGLGINPLEMELTNASLNLMSGSGQQYVTGLVGKLEKMGKDKNVIDAVKLYFAQKAAGVEGLLTRVTGATVNPNLELLFQGPTLRPFNFTFRLSPRDSIEATTVRKIIRAFKQYSAVGTASGGLFLTTPNVFNISYHNRGNRDSNHPSLNRIKTCALKSVSVDYTPDGSYMTFNDTSSTMTSYSISLQFQELEPVTTSDYVTDKIPYNEIGY
jgi:hypothetical protein